MKSSKQLTSPENITALYHALCAARGFDAEKVKGKKSMNLFDMNDFSHLMAAHNYIQQGNYFMALIELHWVAEECYGNVRLDFAKATQKRVNEIYRALTTMVQVKKAYQRFRSTEYPQLLQNFDNRELYNEGDLNADSVVPEQFVNINKALDKNMYRGYSYEPGSEPIEDDLFNYRLTSKLVVTDTVSTVLGNTSYAPHTTVSLAMILEEPADYSYFIFIIRYKDHTWFYTDNIEHHNPLSKVSSRSPHRKVEDKHNTVALPYRLLNELYTSENQYELVKHGQPYFSEVKDIREYFLTVEKFFMQNLILGFLTKIKTEQPQRRLITMGDYLRETKLIGEMPVTKESNSGFSGWGPKQEAFYRELASSVNMRTDLIRLDTTQLEAKVGNWLATPEKFEQLTRWVAFDQQREALQNQLIEVCGGDYHLQKGRAELAALFRERIPTLLQKITSAKQIVVRSDRSDYSKYNLIKERKSTYEFDDITLGSYHSKSYGERSRHTCQCCHTRRESHEVYIKARERDVLVWLLDLNGIEELPPPVRLYRTNSPSGGNTILDNVHPLADLYHPYSQRERGGLLITLKLCKTCWNQSLKQNSQGEELVLDFREKKTKDDDN